MFEREKGLVFEKLKKNLDILILRDDKRHRKLFRSNEIVRVGGSNPVYRLYCFFAFGGKEEGIFGHAREIV
jgi:hypothetical protein